MSVIAPCLLICLHFFRISNCLPDHVLKAMITHKIIDIRQWKLRNAAPKYFIDSRLSSIQSTSRLSEAKLPDNRAVTTSPPDPHKMVSGTWCPPWARNQCNWSPDWQPCYWWQPDQRLYWCIHVPTVHTFSELELVWKRRNKSLSTYENKFRAYLLLLWAWRTENGEREIHQEPVVSMLTPETDIQLCQMTPYTSLHSSLNVELNSFLLTSSLKEMGGELILVVQYSL